MSRPGYWKTKEGSEMAITSMTDSHLKHSLRYLRNALREPGNQSQKYAVYCETKLIELGNEAQRRGLIPAGEITTDQLKEYISVWQAEWDNRTRPVGYHSILDMPASVPITQLQSGNIRINQPNSADYEENYRRLDLDI